MPYGPSCQEGLGGMQASGACGASVTEDCSTGDLSVYEWGELSAVTFTAGVSAVNPLDTSSQTTTSGRRRLQQTVRSGSPKNRKF